MSVFEGDRDVLLFGIGEAPYLVNLEQFAIQSTHGLVHVGGASLTRADEQSFNGFLGCAGQAAGATHGAAFDKAMQDLSAFISGENVHTFYWLTKCLT